MGATGCMVRGQIVEREGASAAARRQKKFVGRGDLRLSGGNCERAPHLDPGSAQFLDSVALDEMHDAIGRGEVAFVMGDGDHQAPLFAQAGQNLVVE